MNFLISFRSELSKTRRASLWYSSVAIALFIPIILFVDYAFQDDISQKVGGNPWLIFLNEGLVFFNMLMCPLFVLLATTILPQMEYRNNAWKQVLVSPQPLLHVYLARFCVVLLLIAAFIVIYVVILVFTGVIIDILWPMYGLSEYPLNTILIMKRTLQSMVCVLGMTALEFWIGIRFRNFIVPLSAGFGFWLIGNILTLELKLPHAEFNPFTYLAHASFPKFEPILGQVMLTSVVYCAVFLTLGFLEFNRNRVR